MVRKIIQEKPKPKVSCEEEVFFILKFKDIEEKLKRDESVVPYDYNEVLNQIENSSNDFIRNRFDSNLLKTIMDSVSNTNTYHPATTACFWCCHTFNWNHFVLPISYDSYKHVFVCENYYCSPECALAYNYNDTSETDSIKWLKHSLLNYLYVELYPSEPIAPAPPRTLLKMFGGMLNINQYREYLTNSKDIIIAKTHPIQIKRPILQICENIQNVMRHVAPIPERESGGLKLKRKNPPVVNSKLFDSLLKSN
jgi:hypothetical protein